MATKGASACVPYRRIGLFGAWVRWPARLMDGEGAKKSTLPT
jgi:hypothetical protein